MTTKMVKDIKRKLTKMREKEISIKRFVADEILDNVIDYDDVKDIKNYFNDILTHGCINGMVRSLIYYKDTHLFFDIYYHEIEELRQEYEYSTGESLMIKSDLKNDLSWFAFEAVARNIANDLGFKI